MERWAFAGFFDELLCPTRKGQSFLRAYNLINAMRVFQNWVASTEAVEEESVLPPPRLRFATVIAR
jgi:hypothetical protein